MKKLLMMVMLAVLCQWGYSQYQPGDYYQEDGLDCVVIKVNEDGQSGLVMTLPGELPLFLPSVEWDIDTTSRKALMKSIMNMSRHNTKSWCSLLLGRFCLEPKEKGEDNMVQVEKYCAENNFDMSKVYPEYDVVKALGDGWVFPGTKELEVLNEFLMDEKGKKNRGKRFQVYHPDDIWKKLSMLNYQLPEECRLLWYTLRYTSPWEGNQVIRKLIEKKEINSGLIVELEKAAENMQRKVGNKEKGGFLAMPFNFGLAIRNSTMYKAKDGSGCYYSVWSPFGGTQIVSFDKYARAVTCAFKQVDFE